MNLYTTVFLEFLLISSSIILLFKFRAKIGLAPLYILLGSVQYLQANFGSSFSFNLFENYEIYPGSIILFSGVLFAILLIYIKEGATSARTLIFGILISNIIMTLMFEITYLQEMIVNQNNNTSLGSPSVFKINFKYFLSGTTLLFLDFLLLVIVYQCLITKIKKLPLFLILFLSLYSVLMFDAMAFNVALFYGTPVFKTSLISHLLGKTISALVFSTILYLYLKYFDNKTTTTEFIQNQKKNIFSIFEYREKYLNLKLKKEQVEKNLTSQIESALNNISDGFISLDTNWCYTYVNIKAGELLGRSPKSLMGKNIWTEFPEGVGLPFYNMYHKAVETQQTQYFQDYYEPFDKWFENRIYPSSKGLTIYFTDISENKKTEIKNKLLLSLIETSDDFIGLASLEGKPIYLNSNGRNLVGLQKNETLLNSITDFFPNKYHDRIVNEHIPNIYEKNKWKGEAEFKNFKTGDLIPIEMSRFLIREDITDKPLALGIVAVNITERKLAKEKLVHGEELFRRLSSNAPVAIFQTDKEGACNYVNEEWMKYSGLTFKEALGFGWSNALHPEDKDRIINLWQQAVSVETEINTDFRFLNKNGKATWLLAKVVGLYDTNNKLYGYIGTLIDVTERKKAEEQLIKSKKYLDNIINNIGDPLFVKDDQSRLLTVNDAFCSLFSVNRADVIGKTLAESVTEEERASYLRIDKEVISTGVENVNEETLTFHGKEFRIISTKKTRFIDDKGNKFLIGTIRDITERKKAEEDIRVSHQRLTTHLSSSPLAIIEWDKNFIIRSWSVQATNIFGWEESEAIGKLFKDLNLVYEDDFASTTIISDELSSGKTKSNKIINRNYTKTNEIIYCQWYNSVLLSPNGEVETIFSLAQDVTDRMAAEENIRESEEKFSKAFNSNVVGKAILNKEKKIVEVNEALAHIVGFERENMLGKTAEEIGLFNFDDQKNLENEKLLWSQFSENGFVSNIELKYLLQGGRLLFLSISLQALQLHGEDYVLITVLDITEKKNAEAELQQHRNNLEKLVKIRTEEVDLKNAELQRMNKLFVGRELKMKELKNIIKELQSKNDKEINN